MEIVTIKLDEITPYENNAKEHNDEQVTHIINSIRSFGMCDPIGVWGESNIIVEGHGRYLALKQMGYDSVPCIRLDHLSDEERRAYTHVHNHLTLETLLNQTVLAAEIADIPKIDMTNFGFDVDSEVDYSHIEDLLDNDFANVGDKPDFYTISIPFPIDKKDIVQKYINKHGKQGIRDLILDYIGGALCHIAERK